MNQILALVFLATLLLLAASGSDGEDLSWPVFTIRFLTSRCTESESDQTRPEPTDCGVYFHCWCYKRHGKCYWEMMTCKANYVYDPTRIPIRLPDKRPDFHMCTYNPNHSCERGMPQRSEFRGPVEWIPPECNNLPEGVNMIVRLFVPDMTNECQAYYTCGGTDHLQVYHHICQNDYGIRFTEPTLLSIYDLNCWYRECSDLPELD